MKSFKFKRYFMRLNRLHIAALFLLSCLIVIPRSYGATPSNFVGLNTPFLFFDDANQNLQIQALKDLNIAWVRIDLHWDRLERVSGQLELRAVDRLMARIQQANLKAVVYLVGSPPFATSAPVNADAKDTWPPTNASVYAARMVSLAKRYPWVDYWQVWNEPNIPTFWKKDADPDGYGALIRAVRSGFNAEPALAGKKIVLGGMAYYSQMPNDNNALMLQALNNNGTLKLVDVVAYHPYSAYPDGDPDPKDPQNFITRSRAINKFLRQSGVKQIWATEFGWSTYTGPVDYQPQISEQQQADYLRQRLDSMHTLDFDKVFVFALSDLDARVTNRDRYYGLLRLDGSKKPAFQTIKKWIQKNP